MKEKNIIIAISLVVIIVLSGCTSSNDASDLDFIVLDKEMSIPQEACSARGLNDKIIVLVTKYCSACKIAVPRLQEIEQELQIEIIYLDWSKDEDKSTIESFRIYPYYTPSVLIGCDVYIGAYSKATFKQLIEAFLAS